MSDGVDTVAHPFTVKVHNRAGSSLLVVEVTLQNPDGSPAEDELNVIVRVGNNPSQTAVHVEGAKYQATFFDPTSPVAQIGDAVEIRASQTTMGQSFRRAVVLDDTAIANRRLSVTVRRLPLSVTAEPTAIKNGQILKLRVTGESGLTVMADLSALDSTQADPVPLTESQTESGLYSALVTISTDNTAESGLKKVKITATDAAGNGAEVETLVTLDNVANVLAILSSTLTAYEDEPFQFTIATRDANGNAAPSLTDVTVDLASSSVTGAFDTVADGPFNGAITSVKIPAAQTSATVFYKDPLAGTATVIASAIGFRSATLAVTVKNAVTHITVSGSPVKAGGLVTVTAIGKPSATATLSMGDFLTNIPMAESTEEAGTYTGELIPVPTQHPEGTHDVIVQIAHSRETVTDALVIDYTAPVLTEATADATTVKNGETVTLTVKSESGLQVWADISTLDPTQPQPVTFTESSTHAGVYRASVVVREDNTAGNGPKDITIHATDAAGNAAEAVTIVVDLRNGAAFDLAVPTDIGTIHIPLKVTAVGDKAMELRTIGDVFDALGGDENVNFIIFYEPQRKRWLSFLGGPENKGTLVDRLLTDEMGLITVMKNAVTLRLQGDALGTDGVSRIQITPGINLVGIPLKDERLERVSDLLNLEGLDGNIMSIIVSDGGKFKVVARAGDDGDIPITGGQSLIIIARQAGVAQVRGKAWENVTGGAAAAPPMTLVGHQVINGQTPVLAVRGTVVDGMTGQAKAGLRVTVKNLSTGAEQTVETEGGYTITFVDAVLGRAARVGDMLLMTVESPHPHLNVQPLRHLVTEDEVKMSQIDLAHLIVHEIPTQNELLPNYPNPFNPETWIPYRLAEDATVTLTIYDTTGRVVRTIPVGFKPAAAYESREVAISWDGRNDWGEPVASGVYFYTLTAGDFSSTRRMLILK